MNYQIFIQNLLSGSLLPSKGADSSLPTLDQLSAELRDFNNWYLLGLQLNPSMDTLDFIEKTHGSSARQGGIKMVQHWISNSENPTWGDVHAALRNIGESVLAAEIADKHDIRPSITRLEKLPTPCLERSNISSEAKPLMPESTVTTKVLKPRQFITEEQVRVSSYFAT